MSYITKHILDPKERLVYATRLHWIYVFEGFVWLVLMLGAMIAADNMMPDTIKTMPHLIIHGVHLGAPYLWGVVPWMLMGIGLFCAYFFKYISTELVVTTLRIIYKTGLIRIEIEEVELDDVEAEHVHHGWLGGLLGYGRLNLDCRFVGDMALPAFRNPYKLLRAVHYVRRKILKMDYPPVVK